MKSIINLVIALFFLGPGFNDVTAAVLRPATTVDVDVVRLGDLFADAGKNQNSIVAAAPPPGAKAVFNAARLQSIARRAGLSWRPQSRHQNTIVTRAGRLISSGDIRKLIMAALIKRGMPADRQIAMSKNNLTLHVAAGDTRDIRVAQTRYNPQGRQFSAIVEVPDDRSSHKRVQVTGSVYEVINVPVLARSIRRGETILARDLEFVEKRRKSIGRNTIIEVDQIVGKTPRRYLQTGKPMRMADLRMPVLVAKGKLVTLMLKNRYMLITAQGKALEDGAKGDVIRVTNTRSRQTVQGVVTGHNRVAIQLSNAVQ
jgi:flagella basal body P-ring formation protein FlgA